MQIKMKEDYDYNFAPARILALKVGATYEVPGQVPQDVATALIEGGQAEKLKDAAAEKGAPAPKKGA